MKRGTTFSTQPDKHIPSEEVLKAYFWEQKDTIAFSIEALEKPRDGGAWWAAVYGVAQSRTRLKRLSSSRESGKKH